MVQQLAWSENFAVGHKVLDAEHRRLVDLINEVTDAVGSKASPRQLKGLLNVLRAVAAEHVRQEDTVLWELKSGTYEPMKGRAPTAGILATMAAAAFDDHVAEHAEFMATFDSIRSSPIETLCETLQAWFLDHAIRRDAHLKAIFQAAA